MKLSTEFCVADILPVPRQPHHLFQCNGIIREVESSVCRSTSFWLSERQTRKSQQKHDCTFRWGGKVCSFCGLWESEKVKRKGKGREKEVTAAYWCLWTETAPALLNSYRRVKVPLSTALNLRLLRWSCSVAGCLWKKACSSDFPWINNGYKNEELEVDAGRKQF